MNVMGKIQHAIQSIPLAVWIGMFVSIVIVGGVSIWRYEWLLMPNYDLGIYHQVVWNSSQGRLFEGTFNEATYLVDHREWLLLLLVPLYWIWADPKVLLIVQAVVVASGAIPLYFLLHHLVRNVTRYKPRLIATCGALFYLAHPSVFQMQLYEFHMLPWILPLTLWLWYCVETKRRVAFWVTAALCLLLREDVAIMMVGVGVLMLVLPGRLRRIDGALLIVVSIVWFACMVAVGSILSKNDAPLFLSLYSWMGDTPIEIVWYIFTHPLVSLGKIFQPYFFLLVLLFGVNAGVLSFYRPLYLLPAIPSWIVYAFMGRVTLGTGMFFYHYGSTMLIWFIIATLYGVAALLSNNQTESRVGIRLKTYFPFSKKELQNLLPMVIAICCFANMTFFGIQWMVVDILSSAHEPQKELRAIERSIPQEDAVYGGYRHWPGLSERTKIYPIQPLLIGTEHYTDNPVEIKEVDWLFLENTGFQYNSYKSLEIRRNAAQRFIAAIEKNNLVPVALDATGAVYGPRERLNGDAVPAFEGVAGHVLSKPIPVTQHLQVTAYEYIPSKKQMLVTFVRSSNAVNIEQVGQNGMPYNDDDLFTGFLWKSTLGLTSQTRPFPIGYGVLLPSTWKENTPMTMRFAFEWPANTTTIQMNVGTIQAGRSAESIVWGYSLVPVPSNTQTNSEIVIPYSCAVSSSVGSTGLESPACIE